jgi:hypothetical protein
MLLNHEGREGHEEKDDFNFVHFASSWLKKIFVVR